MADAVTDQRARMTLAIRNGWLSFLGLGLLFIACGVLAVALPEISTLATSITVGLVLATCGVMQIVQAFRTNSWDGFIWHLAIGIIQLVGGAVIYLDPFAGAIAITLLIAVILVVQGAAQLGLALRVRPFDGWGWLALAGLVAVGAGVLVALKLPVAGLSVPGTMVGLSLLFTGSAYVAIALAARRIVKLAAA